jgi:hypothetical protein
LLRYACNDELREPKNFIRSTFFYLPRNRFGSRHARGSPHGAQAAVINARRTQMQKVNETVVRYLAAWNERDPQRRRELVAATWIEEGSYIDAHRRGDGHSAIDAMLAATQAQFPNYRLNLVSGIEAHNNFVRFSWGAGGTADAPLYIGGTDFATIAPDGRIKTVTGFMDAAPAM